MSTEQMRAEFEAWADGEGYDLQRNELTDYETGATRIAWSGWQASRAALVIELPKPQTTMVIEHLAIDVCRRRVEAAGVRTK